KSFVNAVMRDWDTAEGAYHDLSNENPEGDVQESFSHDSTSQLGHLEDENGEDDPDTDNVLVVRSGAKLVGKSAVDDYRYRPVELDDVCLYDWVQCAVRKPLAQLKGNPSGYRYREGHPMCASHGVIYSSSRMISVVPSLIGGYIPRADADDRDYYCCTMMTFFVPWRTGLDLKSSTQNWTDVFDNHIFDSRYLTLIQNMNIRYECYDARDDYHLQLKARAAAQIDGEDDQGVDEGHDDGSDDPDLETYQGVDDTATDPELAMGQESRRALKQMLEAEMILQSAGWVVDGDAKRGPIASSFNPERSLPGSKWKEIVSSERKVRFGAKRAGLPNAMTVSDQMDCDVGVMNDARIIPGAYLLSDFELSDSGLTCAVTATIESYTLNSEQERAFKIVAHHALSITPSPLRMYIGGQGGTGKTRVLEALQHWFDSRGEAYRMIVLGPTGASASIIGGSTYHSYLAVVTG
ncbi:hypothetical protein DFP72DRAFT_762276, partial [Ephemerocybe angulata]